MDDGTRVREIDTRHKFIKSCKGQKIDRLLLEVTPHIKKKGVGGKRIWIDQRKRNLGRILLCHITYLIPDFNGSCAINGIHLIANLNNNS